MMNLLENIDLIQQLSKCEKKKGYAFSSENVPMIPVICEIKDLHVLTRLRYSSFGKVDNLVLTMGKTESISIGLWLISAIISSKHECYKLIISDKNSKVKKIEFTPNENDLDLKINSFTWQPKTLNSFLKKKKRYLGQKINIYLTNEDEEWFSEDEYYNRDVIRGFGGDGGALLAAEFFLNLGHSSSDLNYEYLNKLTDSESCEIRVEIKTDSGSKKDIHNYIGK